MKIRRGKMDMILNLLCLILLIGITLWLPIFWDRIPDQVPMHYDFAGNIDRWGKKSEMLLLPVMAWLLYLLLTVIERFPKIWNTGVTVTEENRERVYTLLLHLISTMKFIIVCIFTWLTVQTPLGISLPGWFMIVVLLAVFGNMGFWLGKVYKNK